MKKLYLSFFVFAQFLALFFRSEAAFAADTRIMVGTKETLNMPMTNDRIVSNFEANRSYCCTISSTVIADGARFGSGGAVQVSSGEANNTFPRATFNGDIAPAVNSGAANARYCFVPRANEAYALPIQFSAGPSGAVTAWCEETTLIGHYNLIATDFAYVEVSVLTNGGDSEDDVYYRVFNGLGNEIVLEFQGQTARFDHSIHDFVEADTFSTLYLVHSGPPNSIFAQVSQYAVESTDPFIFRPVTQIPMTKRAQ